MSLEKSQHELYKEIVIARAVRCASREINEIQDLKGNLTGYEVVFPKYEIKVTANTVEECEFMAEKELEKFLNTAKESRKLGAIHI